MKIAIIGTGNLAFHLVNRLKNKVELVVFSRTQESKQKFLSLANNVKVVLLEERHSFNADIYIIAVKDSAIAEVASLFRQKPLVHTAGAVDMSVLSFFSEFYGVLYPFQTFRKEFEVDWNNVPIFLESCCKDFDDKLLSVAKLLSNNIFWLSSNKRKYLHLAGVLANNFVNHLMFWTKKIFDDNNLDFKWILPILNQTIKNLEYFEPYQLQTGPAKRADYKTIEEHLKLLNQCPELKEIYKTLTNSILEIYKE